MLERLNDLDCELRQLFRKRIASEVYLKLKRKPMTYGEIRNSIGCSDNSLTNRLKEGKRKGVWVSENGYYKLTHSGEQLPEAVAIHAVAQRDGSIEFKGDQYQHANVAGSTSMVMRIGESGAGARIDREQCEDEEPKNPDPVEWFNG